MIAIKVITKYPLPAAILEEQIYQKSKQENPIKYLMGNKSKLNDGSRTELKRAIEVEVYPRISYRKERPEPRDESDDTNDCQSKSPDCYVSQVLMGR